MRVKLLESSADDRALGITKYFLDDLFLFYSPPPKKIIISAKILNNLTQNPLFVLL